MIVNNCEINILVKGRPITEFFHRGLTFVEGRGGNNYEIEFRNRNNYRVEVIPSVDGLSVTDGKIATPQSGGYVVDANGTLKVPGWTLDNSQVAAFAFSSEKGGSYTEQTTGSDVNKGVIGALVYAEKPAAYMPPAWTLAQNIGCTINNGLPYSWNQNQNRYGGDGAYAYGIGADGSGPFRGIAASANADPTGGASVNSVGAISVQSASMSPNDQYTEQSLGTAFGEATNFKTTQVSFTRGDMVAIMMLYYDDLRGLKARGVVIPTRQQQGLPQAFAGMGGCVPPPGWKG